MTSHVVSIKIGAAKSRQRKRVNKSKVVLTRENSSSFSVDEDIAKVVKLPKIFSLPCFATS